MHVATLAGMRRLLALIIAFACGCGDLAGAPATHKSAHGAQDDGQDDVSETPGATPPTGEDDPTSAPPAPPSEPPPFDVAKVESFFATEMTAAHVPGASVALIKGGKVRWTHGFGLADVAAKKPATADTLFELASVSKTIVSVAIMQLVENPTYGITLDTDVATRLPFAVRNPRFPGTPITLRMLVTHTSSLIDGAALDASDTADGDSPIALGDWLSATLKRSDAWATSAPGTTWSYSNTAISLVGFLVQRVAGMPLEDFCKKKIWGPLGMNETSWFIAGLDRTHVAMPYHEENGRFVAQGYYGFPDYPDGQLRTSAAQLGRFLAMFTAHGTLDGAQILKPATADAMRTPQVPGVEPSQGIVWYFEDQGSTRVLGHNGAYLGISTDMHFDPADGAGYVLLTNGGVYYPDDASNAQLDAMTAMNGKLLALAKSYP
jgi:CubicO group peptidase (beta-lactamase class C family)